VRILLASPIDPDTVAALSAEHEIIHAYGATESTLIDAIDGCDVLVFRSGVTITRAVLDAAPTLSLILRAGSGFDNIDLDAVRRRGIRFVRIPGPGANAVAELCFTLLLALARDLLWADSAWRAGRWVKAEARGRLLTGRVLGVVGAGNIGARVGEMGAAWGMRVLGCVENLDPATTEELARRGVEAADLTTVLREADFVSVHVPLQDSTRHLIDADALATMKPGSYLVSLARGGVVDEGALRDALEAGHLAGAGLDVHAVEGDGHVPALSDLPSVILTPHIGACTVDSQRQIGRIVAECIDDALADPPRLIPCSEDFSVIGTSGRIVPHSKGMS
jgi:D-3-phosphoglycerate dehydrogenase / 2-oxoglutarate reductase